MNAHPPGSRFTPHEWMGILIVFGVLVLIGMGIGLYKLIKFKNKFKD